MKKLTIDRISSDNAYLDACKVLKEKPDPALLKQRLNGQALALQHIGIMMTVIRAINGNKVVDFTNSSYLKYWPVHYWSGSRLAYLVYDCTGTDSNCPAGLCLFSSEDAKAVGEKFISHYEKINFIKI